MLSYQDLPLEIKTHIFKQLADLSPKDVVAGRQLSTEHRAIIDQHLQSEQLAALFSYVKKITDKLTNGQPLFYRAIVEELCRAHIDELRKLYQWAFSQESSVAMVGNKIKAQLEKNYRKLSLIMAQESNSIVKILNDNEATQYDFLEILWRCNTKFDAPVMVKILLALAKKDKQLKQDDLQKMLYFSVMYKRSQSAAVFLEAGADPNAGYNDIDFLQRVIDNPSFVKSEVNESKNIICLLISYGMKFDSRVVDWAIKNNQIEVLKLALSENPKLAFYRTEEKKSPIFQAADKLSMNSIMILHHFGVKLNIVDGNLSLPQAICQNVLSRTTNCIQAESILIWLIEHGAPMHSDIIDYAIEYNAVNLLRVLTKMYSLIITQEHFQKAIELKNTDILLLLLSQLQQKNLDHQVLLDMAFHNLKQAGKEMIKLIEMIYDQGKYSHPLLVNFAAQHNQVGFLEKLLNRYPECLNGYAAYWPWSVPLDRESSAWNNWTDGLPCPPLVAAIEAGSFEAMIYLLDQKGAYLDISYDNNSLVDVLLNSVVRQDPNNHELFIRQQKILIELIKRGITIAASDINRMLRFGFTEAIDLMLQKCPGGLETIERELAQIIFSIPLDLSRTLLTQVLRLSGSDTNVTHAKLMLLVMIRGRLDLLKIFIDEHKDINQTYTDESSLANFRSVGDSLLMRAFKIDNFRAACLLLDAGADMEIKNKAGKTVWDLAIEKKSTKYINLFTQHRYYVKMKQLMSNQEMNICVEEEPTTTMLLSP